MTFKSSEKIRLVLWILPIVFCSKAIQTLARVQFKYILIKQKVNWILKILFILWYIYALRLSPLMTKMISIFFNVISISDRKMVTRNFLVLLVTLMLSKISTQQLVSLKQLAEWKELEFEFPSSNIRENAILNNGYIPGNSVPIDVDIDYRGTKGSDIVAS